MFARSLSRILFLSAALASTAAFAQAPAPAPAPADAEAAFARASGCMACHAVDRRMVGPSFLDISTRYAGQADAVERMARVIRQGGQGSWGPVPMPANTRLSEADAKRLAQWSLSHR